MQNCARFGLKSEGFQTGDRWRIYGLKMYLNNRCRDWLSASRRGVSNPSANRLERRQRGGPFVVRAALLVLLARPIASTALAQEAVRESMAGAEAAQAQKNAFSTPGYYNIQVGPTYWRFAASAGLEYDSNITLSQNSQEGDFLYLPSLTANLLWPISEIQSLNLSLGAGYSGYFQHSTLNRAYITPNSEVSFNIYAGDFRINLHDRFSITENSYQDPTVADNGAYSQFQNGVGIGALWDLNKVVINLAYDHSTGLELSGGQDQPDQSTEIVSATAGYTLKPGMVLGLEFGGALEHFSATSTNTPYTDATEWNVGSFFRTKVTEHLSFNVDAGYVVNSPQVTGALPTAKQFTGYYATAGITHTPNQFVQYSLSGGRSLSTTLLGGPIDSYTANLSANWNVIQKVSLDTSFVYTRGSQVGVSAGESFDQYGPLITVSRRLTKKLTSGLSYQLLLRGSDLANRGYTLNVVTLTLTYQF